MYQETEGGIDGRREEGREGEREREREREGGGVESEGWRERKREGESEQLYPCCLITTTYNYASLLYVWCRPAIGYDAIGLPRAGLLRQLRGHG